MYPESRLLLLLQAAAPFVRRALLLIAMQLPRWHGFGVIDPCEDGRVHGLRRLGEALSDDAWFEARAVVTAIANELRDHRPECLADVRTDWSEPWLALAFVHADGSVLEVGHGDGYTSIVGGDVSFHGYLKPSDLISVITGAFAGHLTNVRHVRVGYKVGDFFELKGADDRRIGFGSQGIVGLPGLALGKLPLLRTCVRRTRVRFDRAPAFSTPPS